MGDIKEEIKDNMIKEISLFKQNESCILKLKTPGKGKKKQRKGFSLKKKTHCYIKLIN